jgi:signal transduction histidine kinase/CheY-like chemotaxis protein
LAEAFNNMVGKLGERKELKSVNGELERTIKKLKKTTEELENSNKQLSETKDDLERAQASREEFLASVSHELRSPLTIIDGYCETLLEEELTDAQRGFVTKIRGASGRELRLVKDLLDYQKVIMGELKLEPCDFDLAARVRDGVEDYRRRAAEKGLTLSLESTVSELPIHADPMRVSQVLDNLLGNALKFTVAGGIVCRLRRESRGEVDWAVIEVQDTGRGMTVEQQAKLFQAFCKILENKDNPTGTGLGLAICRAICRSSGGEAKADPHRTAVGVGSTFVVELPLSPVAGLRTWAPPLATMDAERTIAGGNGAAGGNVALVIDDDPDVADLLRQFFVKHGFEAVVALGGAAGLDEARRLRPRLITLDVEMPTPDGWQVLRLLKSESATADIPVVLVTIADDKQTGFALGASEYLTKPIDWTRLSAIVDRYRQREQPARVLVVEDDAAQRELLTAGLRARGCEVVEAANGRLALVALEDFVPDLILLDLIMPELDGFEFLEALRDKDELRDATVVVVSGKELDAADYERLRAQVAGVIAKGKSPWEEIQGELGRLVRRCAGRTILAGDRPE